MSSTSGNRSRNHRPHYPAWIGLVAAVAVATATLAACGGGAGSDADADAGAAAVPSVATNPALTKAPATVGVISTDSGPLGNGNAVPVTMTAWENYVNAHGGIDGHPVKVVELDDAADPSLSISDAQELIKQDHVLAIINLSQLSAGWAKIADQNKVPILDGANDFQYASDPNYFPVATTVLSVIYGAVYAAKQAGANSFGYFYCAEQAACSQALPLAKQAAQQLGLKFVTSQAISSSSPDYTAQCLAAKNAGADSIELALSGTRVADSCQSQGYHPIWVAPSFSFTDSFRADSALAGTVGNIGTFPWFLNVPQTQEFRAAMHNYLPDFKGIDSLALMSTAWVAAKVFQTALSGRISATPTSQDVYDGLYSFKGETIGGLAPPLTYVAGKPHSVPCFFLMGINDKKFVSATGLKTVCQPSA